MMPSSNEVEAAMNALHAFALDIEEDEARQLIEAVLAAAANAREEEKVHLGRQVQHRTLDEEE